MAPVDSLSTRTTAALVFLVVSALSAVSLGSIPIWTKGEARESLVVAGMLEQGEFVLPRRNATDMPSKPPLFHWLAAGAVKVGGRSIEAALRLPSAVAAGLAAAMCFLIVAAISPRAAPLATLVLVTSADWIRNAGHARVDMVFAATLSIALLFLFLALTTARRPAVPAGISAVAFALAVLAKGPAALALGGCIGMVFVAGASRHSMTGLVAAHPWRVLVAVMFSGALLGGTWYALATAAGGRDFLATQLWNEQLGRLMPMDNFEPGHRTPPYFSAVYLVVAALPWSAFLPQASIAAWRSRRQESREGLFVRFCAIWVLVFVVAVTASISRRSAYFVPALPAIAVLVSAGLRSSASEIPGWARWFSVTILALLAAAAAVAWTFLVGTVSYREGLARMVGERAMADAAVIAAAAPRMVEVLLGAAVVAWIVAVVRTSRRGRAVASTASAVVLTAMAAATVLPTVAQAYSPRRFMADVRAMVSDGPLVQLAPVAFEATFYAGRPVPVVPMDRLVAVDADLFVLVRLSDLPAVRAAVPSAIVLLQQTSRIALGNRQLTLLRIPQAVRSSLLH